MYAAVHLAQPTGPAHDGLDGKHLDDGILADLSAHGSDIAVRDGELSRGFQEVLFGQALRSQASVAANSWQLRFES